MSTLAGAKWKIHPIWKYSGLILSFVALGFLFAHKGPLVFGAILAIPAVVWVLSMLYRYPRINLYVVMFLSFFMAVIGRYIPVNIPWSLVVDISLLLALLMPAIKYWHNTDYRLASRSIAGLLGLWMFYIILQIFNPEAHSILAWFYAMRGIALYPLLIVLSCLILFNSKKDFYRFLNIWLALSLLGILWAIKQKFLGLSAAEEHWLNVSGARGTHVLFGKLRIFSYYFDASTFGSAMGHICIVSLILFLGPFKRKWKAIYLSIGLLSFYALMLSGTRGSLAVPAIGAITYLVMIRKVKLILLGLAVLAAGFVFLKYTTIGNSNYSVNRLRTAVNPNDASLNLRLENRRALSNYLEGKPFGGGVGTAGYWGKRFSPGTWLAQFSTDGLYTQIRAETGIVGRNLFVGILLIILFRGMKIMWRLGNKKHQTFAMAILSGYAGVLMANYGNAVMTQFPNNFLVFVGLAFVYSMKYWNEEGDVELPDGHTPIRGTKRITTSWKN